jgi:phosphoribosylformylglycinamidine cyclo-ligase
VEKARVISGMRIVEGDAVVGLASSGLHTNGYSLVRKVFGIDRDAISLKIIYPELGRTLGEALLQPHRCYHNDLKPFLDELHGLAHITGGGLVGNIPRVLPESCAVQIDRSSWQVPSIFELIQKRGSIKDDEMYRVFNMGIGMAAICGQETADKLLSAIKDSRQIGKIVKANGSERVIIQ